MTSHPKDLSDKLIQAYRGLRQALQLHTSAGAVGEQQGAEAHEQDDTIGRAYLDLVQRLSTRCAGDNHQHGYHRWFSGRDGRRF